MKNHHSAVRLWATLLLLQSLTLACAKLSTPEEVAAALTGSSGANKLNVAGPVTATPNQCVPVIMTLQNSSGSTITSTEAMVFNMTGIGTDIYSDDTCLTTKSMPLVWTPGASSNVVYVKPALTQIYTILITEVAQKVTGAYQIISVSNGAVTNEDLRLVMSGPTAFMAGQCIL